MQVVLDTNLIVRAARPRASLARSILLAAISEPHRLLLSSSLFFEMYRVMHYDYVRLLHELTNREIDEFLDSLYQACIPVYPKPISVGPLVGADPTDDHVLLAAISGHADVLGTNNRHFFDPSVIAIAGQHNIQVLRDVELIRALRGT